MDQSKSYEAPKLSTEPPAESPMTLEEVCSLALEIGSLIELTNFFNKSFV